MSVVIVPQRRTAAIVTGRGQHGPKGDPGGNVMAVGLKSDAGELTIPAGAEMVRTSGYDTPGLGIADYIHDAAVDAAYAAANPQTSFVSANGRGFRLPIKEAVNLHKLGAKGDGAANDTAALVKAFELGAAGVPIFVPAGIFLVETKALDLQNVGTDRFVMFGEGASSVIKVMGGEIAADNERVFYIRPNSPMDLIEFRDLVIDNNARGSAPPPAPYDYEHSHTFQVLPSAAVKMIRFDNVVVKDPAADVFYHFSGTEDLVTYYVVNNCAVTDRTRVRSDVQMSSLPKNLIVNGFVGSVIEFEPTMSATTKKRIQFTNCTVDRLDIGSNNGLDEQLKGLVEVQMVGVSAPVSCTFLAVKVLASRCVLGVGGTIGSTNRLNYLSRGSQFDGCEFQHAYNGAGVVTPLQIYQVQASGFKTGIAFNDCRFTIATGAPDDPVTPGTNPLIDFTSAVPAAQIADHRVEFNNCKFDKRAYMSFSAQRAGTVVARDCKYGGTFAAFRVSTSASYGVDLTIDGGDFSDVAGALLAGGWADANQVATIMWLRLRGEWTGYKGQALVVNFSSTPSAAQSQAQIRSNRRILAGATPASGLLGDIIELDGSALAAGAVDSYRCTASSAGAATWKARTTLAA